MKITNVSNGILHFRAYSSQNQNTQTSLDTLREKYSNKSRDMDWGRIRRLIAYKEGNDKELLDEDLSNFIQKSLELPQCANGHNLAEVIETCNIKDETGRYKIDKNALLFAQKMLEFGNSTNDVAALLRILKNEYHTIFDNGKLLMQSYPVYNNDDDNYCYTKNRYYFRFDEEIMSDILSDAISRNKQNSEWNKISAREYYNIIIHCKSTNKYNKMDYNEFYRFLNLA